MFVNVKIFIDRNAVGMKIKSAAQKAVAVTAEQVLEDCNKFCPEEYGVLINSSYVNTNISSGISTKNYNDEQKKTLAEAQGSDLKEGHLVWHTPYARYLYYGLLMVDSKTGSAWAHKGDKKVLTSTPLTYHKRFKSSTPCKLWCEKARETYNEDWRLIFENALRGNL